MQKRQWRHHYVPEMLLKHFGDDNGLLHYIDCASNVRRPPAKPRDLGYGRDFYRDEERDDPDSVERAFQKIESDGARVLQRVMESRSCPTTADDWLPLMTFVALQAVRVPATKAMIAGPIEHEHRIVADLLVNDARLYRTSAQLIGIDPSQTPYEEFLAMNEESLIPKLSVGEFVEYATAMMKPILESLNVRLWSVIYSEKPGEHFVVSDDPVVLYWSDGKTRRLPPGYNHINSDVTIPISSNMALLVTHQDFKVTPESVRHHVARTNSKTIAAAHHFVGAKSDTFICYGDDGVIETSCLAAPSIPPLEGV